MLIASFEAKEMFLVKRTALNECFLKSCRGVDQMFSDWHLRTVHDGNY